MIPMLRVFSRVNSRGMGVKEGLCERGGEAWLPAGGDRRLPRTEVERAPGKAIRASRRASEQPARTMTIATACPRGAPDRLCGKPAAKRETARLRRSAPFEARGAAVRRRAKG